MPSKDPVDAVIPDAPQLDPEFDRRALQQLRQRFLDINAGRLERARRLLATRQQRVLRLLPLLFQVNHPALPGYVSATTPCGFDHYAPAPAVLGDAQTLARSFRYHTRRHAPAALHGLFLMGSLGTLAQAEQSDMDLWLCHDPQLSAAARAELRRKASLLESWAASQGAELHVFLIDPPRFASGQRDAELGGEDCGSSQHYLLLDEFYRTALWLAGRTPTWWLVPADQEPHYAGYVDALQARGLLRADERLDLGHLGQLPANEFLGAGLWQLYKCIESPYKSTLKLLLNEAYASDYPRSTCLALQFKRAVFAGSLDLDELDPYLLLYRRLEDYLGSLGDQPRLALMRRCLYLKINRPLSRPTRNLRKSWQRQLLERLSAPWGWDERLLQRLDNRPHWKLRQVDGELRLLAAALIKSYRYLQQFARTQLASHPLSRRDLTILGRRLRVVFARGGRKIETLNPGIAPNLWESHLTLQHLEGGQWVLHGGSLTLRQCQDVVPLKRSADLAPLLAWAIRNGIIDSASRLTLHPGRSALSDFELQGLRSSLLQTLPSPQAPVADADLLRSARAERLVLLVNVGLDPLRSLTAAQLASGRSDVLDYSGARLNLVQSLDLITVSSWNEVHCTRYAGPHALLDCLREQLDHLAQPAPASLTVRCFNRNRASAICSRVEGLFEQAAQALVDPYSRFLLQLGEAFHLLQRRDAGIEHAALSDLAALHARLADAQPCCSLLDIDAQALSGQHLALILRAAEPDCLQVFYQLGERRLELYLLDERNVLTHQSLAGGEGDLHTALGALAGRPAAESASRYYRLLPDAPLQARELVRQRPPVGDAAARAAARLGLEAHGASPD
jgi:adenylate cyclase class 1